MEVGLGRRANRRDSAAHLTLRFLGEVAPDRNTSIIARLKPIAQATAPFPLRIEGVGAFPSSKRPRVVWLGVTTGRSEVVELACRVRGALEPEFGREPGAFVPHLTLFRVRSPSDRTAALELLDGTRQPPPPRDATIKELVLKESRPYSKGAIHRIVCAIPLGPRFVDTA